MNPQDSTAPKAQEVEREAKKLLDPEATDYWHSTSVLESNPELALQHLPTLVAVFENVTLWKRWLSLAHTFDRLGEGAAPAIASIVATLIPALTNTPDGEIQSQICSVLQVFSAAAAPAVPTLIGLLTSTGSYQKSVVDYNNDGKSVATTNNISNDAMRTLIYIGEPAIPALTAITEPAAPYPDALKIKAKTAIISITQQAQFRARKRR